MPHVLHYYAPIPCYALTRLNRLIVEAGLGHLPFTERTVTTPTGQKYVGVEFAKKICGVSLIRSGESMEAALRECCQGIKICKILIHRCARLLAGPGRLTWTWRVLRALH